MNKNMREKETIISSACIVPSHPGIHTRTPYTSSHGVVSGPAWGVIETLKSICANSMDIFGRAAQSHPAISKKKKTTTTWDTLEKHLNEIRPDRVLYPREKLFPNRPHFDPMSNICYTRK